MDLFCNSELVENVTKTENNNTIQVNGGTLAVTHKATVPGYKQDVWFIKYYITNIIALKNLIKQYRVTYDSIYQILVVHREDNEKPNMEFKINESGIHCYNQTDNVLVLINDVSQNKQRFSKSKINGAEQAKTLYAKLGYPQVKDFRWIFQSQKIIYCPVMVQDIEIAHIIWGKIIAALKVIPLGRNQSMW